ncbi:hypothetical protein MKW94_012192 [Papaver nudicaule]|uniref:Uncharacterized protein n=1 Tax=Papaver nudicaule TaxID=74823 RepID=A0AA42B5C2_PAPNU|nr:hypothetical protein [Papaver nudicaule]
MGNCQAIDAASLVIQHTNGREERLYWPVMAKEIMRLNPGYYVALIITYCVSEQQEQGKRSSNPYSSSNSNSNTSNGVRITRVKLLRPSDTLTLGQAYKLIDSQEVMKGLWAKKFAKMKKKQESSDDQSETRVGEIQSSGFHQIEETSSELGEPNQASTRPDRHRQPSSGLGRSRHWRPSLQSISEATN